MKIIRIPLIIVGISLWTFGLNGQQLIDINTTHAGNNRGYKLYIPPTYDGNTAVPLLFNFHGGGGTSQDQINLSDMRPFADTANFLIVYPQAFPDPNDGNSNNWIHKDPTDFDDVPFVESILNEMISAYNINENRVYVCGYSLGGEFTYELLCRLNNKIAAGVAVARTMATYTLDQCNPTHPTAVMTILGTDDPISVYTGVVYNGVTYYLSSDDVNAYWTNYNNTDPNPIISQVPNTNSSDGSTVEKYLWGNGDGCVSFVHYKINAGGHDWPGTFGNMDIDADTEIWNFVSQYNRGGLIDCPENNLEENDMTNISLYPNPVIKDLYFNLSGEYNTQIEVYTQQGALMIQTTTHYNQGSIDVSTLCPGIYTFKIGNSYKRFIKE